MKKTKPLLLWIYLSIGGMFFITLSDSVAAGEYSGLGKVLTISLFRDLLFVPITILGFYLTKFLAKSVGSPKLFSGSKSLSNSLIIWLVLFFIALVLPRILS